MTHHSISALVNNAVGEIRAGFQGPPERHRFVYQFKRGDDSRGEDPGFDESLIAPDSKLIIHLKKDTDQKIVNLYRQEKIPSQERKVNVTTAICFGEPDKVASLVELGRQVEPTPARALKRHREPDNKKEKARRTAHVSKVVKDAAKKMNKDPQVFARKFEKWLQKKAALDAILKRKKL